MVKCDVQNRMADMAQKRQAPVDVRALSVAMSANQEDGQPNEDRKPERHANERQRSASARAPEHRCLHCSHQRPRPSVSSGCGRHDAGAGC